MHSDYWKPRYHASKYVAGGVEVFTRLHLPSPDSSILSTRMNTYSVHCALCFHIVHRDEHLHLHCVMFYTGISAHCSLLIARVKLYNA